MDARYVRLRRAVATVSLLVVCQLAVPGAVDTGLEIPADGLVLKFPAPPDADAIGTAVGVINSYVKEVTLSPASEIHRFGLTFWEIRGSIRGIGWGGSFQGNFLSCPYDYDLPYVLRIPPDWNGGLVIYRHEFDTLDELDAVEAALGDRNFFRVIHETHDRGISDAALHPNRRWAYFAVNQIGVAPGGAHNTLVLDAPGCTAGTPVQSTRDATIARDHALLAQRVLKVLTEHDTTVTLGVGFVQGATTNMSLNAGLRQGDAVRVGDNHRVPYDRASGRIFDGFISVDMSPQFNQSLDAVSAPTIFLFGDAVGQPQLATINQISRLTQTPNLDVPAYARLYSVRNVPLLDADWNLSLIRENIAWADASPDQPDPLRGYFLGSGERLRPIYGALLDRLAEWATRGTPPPTSLFNGVVTGAQVDYVRTGTAAHGVPYVDDESLDTYVDNVPNAPNSNQRTQLTNVRTKLGGRVDSIVLPETRCRRGKFNFQAGIGPSGADFHLDEETFSARWPSLTEFQRCRIDTVDTLVDAGLYDPTFVTIDINPSQATNWIDLRSRDRLTVAIFSTNGFDAATIVPGSLRLAGASQQGAAGIAGIPGDIHGRLVDLNGDGRMDLRVEFRVPKLQFTHLDVVVDVWGITRDGVPFAGSDLVQIVP